MSIKIYFPANYFNQKRHSNLYGQVQIGEDNVIVYYVVDVERNRNPYAGIDMHSHEESPRGLHYLGAILHAEIAANFGHSHDMRICFTYTPDLPNIRLNYVGIMPENVRHIKLILYDKHTIQNLMVHDEASVPEGQAGFRPEYPNNNECDFLMLRQLINSPIPKKKKKRPAKNQMGLLQLFAMLPTLFFKCADQNQLVNKIIKHSSVYKHHNEWQATYDKGSRRTNIVFDRFFGLILMVILFKYVSHPSDFLIQVSHAIIKQLYALLKILEGGPVGLKLNIHLNHFFLDCFTYHIELWSTFLDLIGPAVRQVFLTIGVFGCLGLTYQIALLTDLISIVGLHAHCFYVYAKVLYQVETNGLAVLWRVVRGNRYNILKGRIEAHNYINRQLYFATLFFSAILFLFPTTLVYYIVFATLKALTFAVLWTFDYFRRKILTFPIATRIKWITRRSYQIDCLRIRNLPPQKEPYIIYKDIRINVSAYRLR